MTTYLTSTWSPGMLASSEDSTVQFRRLMIQEAQDIVRNFSVINGIGHNGTLAQVNTLLNTNFLEIDPKNRPKVTMIQGDLALIFQYCGPRLEEGQVMTSEEVRLAFEKGQFDFMLATILGTCQSYLR